MQVGVITSKHFKILLILASCAPYTQNKATILQILHVSGKDLASLNLHEYQDIQILASVDMT